jgi:hypothetical protein
MRSQAVLSLVLLIVGAAGARADEDPSVTRARQRFVEGAALVRKAQWAEALAAFEESAQKRPHPVTTFNIAACERALGRYTRARRLFELARREPQGELPPSLQEEARGLIAEIDHNLVQLEVTVDPPNASLLVDGRPAEVKPDAPGIAVAGTLDPGPGAVVLGGRFTLELDPGQHVITLAQKGYANLLLNRSFAAGSRGMLPLTLARLPARLHVSSNRSSSLVTVDGQEAGRAPIEVELPAGGHKVMVRSSGAQAYRAQVTLTSGEETRLHAQLEVEKIPLYKRWWFWTAAGALLTGAAVGAYYGARASEPPQLDGGGLQWTAKVR